jgi:error-prone DNA polymerase
MRIPQYAELWCLSNFSFLRGASRPEELVERAHALGYTALALTDECSLAGVVRAHVAAKEVGLKLLLGAQFEVQCDTPFTLVLIARNLEGYGNISEFITSLRRASAKGAYELVLDQLRGADLQDCLALVAPRRGLQPGQIAEVAEWAQREFEDRCWMLALRERVLGDEMWLYRLREASAATGIPLVAAGDVHMHVRSRKPLQDVLTATRLRLPLTECGGGLQPNAERHLRTKLRLAQLYPPDLLDETLRVAGMCEFSMEELRYQYPDEVVPAGETPGSYLRTITWEGAGRRWPEGVSAKVHAQIEHELELIADLRYEHYFLTVYDIVRFARSRHILCQGRGSAANSVVCF